MIKILYLEDNKFDIELTRIELTKAFPDSKITITNTLAQAKQALKDDPVYDVAILDLNLPDGNGIDTLIYIREQNFEIAVIILTGSGNEEAAIAALKAGADDYLTKKQGYLQKLPDTIHAVVKNFKENIEKRSKPLKVLYVEWNKPDIEFTKRHMQKYAPHIFVHEVSEATEALTLLPKSGNENCNYDVLLLDYRLPGINALECIKIIRQERKLPIPIVLVTGHGSEEIAVQALKLGADDYLVKRDNYLFRLPSLLTGAYYRVVLERQQKSLLESEVKYRVLAENSSDVIFILDSNLNYRYVSPAVKELRGFEVEEVLKQNISKILTPESKNKAYQIFTQLIPDVTKPPLTKIEPQVLELEMFKKDGSTVWTEVKVSVLMDENNILTGFQGVTRDISQRKITQNELLKSREEYQSFFEDDLTGDFITSVDGHILNCNQAYLNILGFKSKEQALNYDITKLRVHKKERDKMLEFLKKNKRINNYKHNLIRTDGRLIHAIGNIIGGFDEDGNLQTIKGYIIDDTEHKLATDELRILSRAVVQSPASVVITDIKGNIEYVNPKFTKITGYTFEEVLDKNPRILKSGNMPEKEYTRLWEKITKGETWQGEFQNKRKDGTLFWEYASISPIKNDEGVITHYLAVKEDSTEKKKYEEELIVARDLAQESNRLKSAFLATMSHELRTPLNAIIGFSSLMDESVEKPDLIRFGQTINNSGIHLLNIIEDIFTVSLLQTKQSKIEKEEFDLKDFYLSLIQYTSIVQENKNKQSIQILFEDIPEQNSIKLFTDKTKIYQVLINFIKNALEYTEKGAIEIGHIHSKADITFFVKDTGIGIPKDKIEIVFQQFRQVDDSHTRVHEGVGLGLAICTEVSKLLDAKIWVESEEGKGSTFFFELNNVIQESKKENIYKISLKTPDFKTKTILVVEDEMTNYLLLETYLNNTKATIIWAKNGEESVEICRNNSDIDLVLMDIRMPGIDGIEASKQIKQFKPNLKIIAQTAYALANERQNILNSSCDDYISKPIKMKELFLMLQNYLK